ncbi:MAG: DEAD/DEAH box helicase family protein [Deltaproteobacteria bacterium]|nr:DEAD/DEAH box helicase family protein [Deltaproteobacteria bacterium]
MPKRVSKTSSELFIVDNSDEDWKVVRYLHDWCQISKSIDIATGYFEIGSLLALKDEWQKVDHIRILMGDEVSLRTKNAFTTGLKKVTGSLDTSLESEKQKNDFLVGVPAIVEAIRSGKIQCRVYRKDKFHAKAYITHARLEVVGSSALVGSSNFTCPGITENIELNVQITGQPVNVLQEWYEEHWAEAEDVTPDILRTIERHTREYSPFEVYAKALQEFFRGHELTASEWEQHGGSKIYPILDQYQREGYHALMKIANRHSGAFLCDGVGLGKTFVGLMLIERLVEYDRKRVALFVPKGAREPVWETELKRYLPHLFGDFSNLVVFNHTDLLRSREFPERLKRVREMADVIVIDEAHHFRNTGVRGEEGERQSRYWQLYDIAEGKTMFLLTATPVNNRLTDLQHMMELFSRRQADYFRDAPLGIHSLPGHFRKMEKELERLILQQNGSPNGMETNLAEAEQVLLNDALFRALVVQRSRAYVKKSQLQHGGSLALFPQREDPKVVEYSVKKTYGRLLSMLEAAFSKERPLFSLAVYYPLAYYKGPDSSINPLEEGRQREVAGLIRTQFLKRFESSAQGFEMSCQTLLLKLLAWATKHSQTEAEKQRLDRWLRQHKELIEYVREKQSEIREDEGDWDEEDVISEEMLEAVEALDRNEFKVEEILAETFLDLDQLAEFLDELKKFKPSHDDKLKALIKLLKTDSVLKKHKVLIFTEFMDTARYLKQQLTSADISGVDEVDSRVKRDRGDIIRQFAPYYNGSSSAQLAEEGLDETRVLVSTDVLSEGLNLQDATRLINYELHWNPVRLMQRIGRVDRRMNPEIEAQIVADHPDQKSVRGRVAYWNFLPPDELDDLLRLYQRVSRKTLRISKTFGIEGKKLLTPQDDYEALKDFTESYEGTTSPSEDMHLEYQQLLQDYPDLPVRLTALPGRVFSGKHHPVADTKAVFFCFALPAPGARAQEDERANASVWTEEAGNVKWYLYDLASGKIYDEPTEIVGSIRSTPDTPRKHDIPNETLSDIQAKLEKHIKNTYLKQVQAPVGVKPILRAWMELS